MLLSRQNLLVLRVSKYFCTQYKLKHILRKKRKIHLAAGEYYCPGAIMGVGHLLDPRLNKGLAFSLEERIALGIHGLQPPQILTQEEQLDIICNTLTRYTEDIHKYVYLQELLDRNEKLFYRLLHENIETLMPIVYTPTVGLACQRYGVIYRRPRGIFLTINDKGNCFNILRNWPDHDIRIIVVTDGERILGLGDLGAAGMGIPVGKLALYTALARIKPYQCLPVTLDVGTNNRMLLNDRTYIGLRQRRAVGEEYDEFIDEFMLAVRDLFGQNTLIQFEDFANKNAYRLLEKYQNKYCVFNDDIQGTAAITLAGLLAANKNLQKKMKEHVILIIGTGVGLHIADIIAEQMVEEGIKLEEAVSKIYMVDADGLLTLDRDDLNDRSIVYAKNIEHNRKLASIIDITRPTVTIGVSGIGGLLKPDMIEQLAQITERPVIFALSNPTSNAECTAQEAYIHSEGKALFASGSPFSKVTFEDRTFYPSQCNNAYIFPGVGLGVIATQMHHIPKSLFQVAATVIADNCTEEMFQRGSLLPRIENIVDCTMQIALKIASFAYETGTATVYPEPVDKRLYLEKQLYSFEYENSVPIHYSWPESTIKKPPSRKSSKCHFNFKK